MFTVNGNAGRVASSTQTYNHSGTLFKVGCLVTLSKLRCSNDEHGAKTLDSYSSASVARNSANGFRERKPP